MLQTERRKTFGERYPVATTISAISILFILLTGCTFVLEFSSSVGIAITLLLACIGTMIGNGLMDNEAAGPARFLIFYFINFIVFFAYISYIRFTLNGFERNPGELYKIFCGTFVESFIMSGVSYLTQNKLNKYIDHAVHSAEPSVHRCV